MEERGYIDVREFADGLNQTHEARDEALVARLMELYRQYITASSWYFDKLRANRDLYKQQALGQRESWEQGYELRRMAKDLCEGAPFTTTPTLLTSIENLKADLMQGYPEAVFVGREPQDVGFAETMNAVHRCLMERSGHKGVHREAVHAMLVYGTAYVETYWDESLEGGKGDVAFSAWEPFNIYPDPYVEDLQEGRAVFKVTYHPLSWYKERYPEHWPQMRANLEASHRPVDTQDLLAGTDYRSEALLECWYKKWDADQKRTALHMCKIAGNTLLYCSEDELPQGVYAHGRYPFTAYLCNRIPGTPWGYGMFDYLGNLQRYIDQADQMILKNIVTAGKLRMLVNRGAGIDPTKAADLDKDVIEGDRIDEGAIRWVQGAPLHPYALSMLQLKTDSLREESGQNNAARGQVGGGITAASAIASLQSAALKRSELLRGIIDQAYEATVRMDVALILERYDDDRVVRIEGSEPGTYEYYRFGDSPPQRGLVLRDVREFAFDLSIKIQQKPIYAQQQQNETLLALVQNGSLPAEVALELMHFDDKPRILQAVRWNSQVMRNLEQQAAQTKQVLEEIEAVTQENGALRSALIQLQQAQFGSMGSQQPLNGPAAGANIQAGAR